MDREVRRVGEIVEIEGRKFQLCLGVMTPSLPHFEIDCTDKDIISRVDGVFRGECPKWFSYYTQKGVHWQCVSWRGNAKNKEALEKELVEEFNSDYEPGAGSILRIVPYCDFVLRKNVIWGIVPSWFKLYEMIFARDNLEAFKYGRGPIAKLVLYMTTKIKSCAEREMLF